MTRHTLSIALALLGLNAHAAWERIVQDPSADIYVDPNSIKRVGGLATMLTLTNLSPPKDPAQAAAMSFKSTIQHDDYDCIKRKVRLRRFTMYSEAMASGKALATSKQDTPWLEVDVGSWNERKWIIACSRQ